MLCAIRRQKGEGLQKKTHQDFDKEVAKEGKKEGERWRSVKQVQFRQSKGSYAKGLEVCLADDSFDESFWFSLQCTSIALATCSRPTTRLAMTSCYLEVCSGVHRVDGRRYRSCSFFCREEAFKKLFL